MSFLDGILSTNKGFDENQQGEGFFTEDATNDALVIESVLCEELTDGQLERLSEDVRDQDCLQEENLLTEGTKIMKIKMTKETVMNRLIGRYRLIIAKEKKDKDFFKLVRIWQIKKVLKQRLKKYDAQAKVRAKKAYKNMMASKSSTARGTVEQEHEHK